MRSRTVTPLCSFTGQSSFRRVRDLTHWHWSCFSRPLRSGLLAWWLLFEAFRVTVHHLENSLRLWVSDGLPFLSTHVAIEFQDRYVGLPFLDRSKANGEGADISYGSVQTECSAIQSLVVSETIQQRHLLRAAQMRRITNQHNPSGNHAVNNPLMYLIGSCVLNLRSLKQRVSGE